ncbi:uncharacterized low-complexity protein [Hahella chejuensis KCTC 2396]|uniref:Uncharacterized low-complexity protein n=2 Tax=Hahella chejuensis TaxID=158327 RepID=Q2SQ01_HAHCH|nr:uncharacterized low-complexity protein [Hahella chejuensis KCTC 2396]
MNVTHRLIAVENQAMTADTQPPDDSFWRDADREESDELKFQLEQRARTGEPMRGFKLSRAELSGIDLVRRNSKTGYQLVESDLYRANLEGAHCFHLDLRGSSLMKANLSKANLHCANLQDCNLLGAVFEQTKIEHIQWGEKLLQEKLAEKAANREQKLDLYQQAEEIYRHLRKVAEQQGLFETAGHFFQKEMLMRRFQLPPFSGARFVSKLVDLFCGYGERPDRVIIFSCLIVLAFSLIYFTLGIREGEQALYAGGGANLWSELQYFLSCLYFSVVTFTTLGYGDIAPVGLTRAFAATEAFVGSFTLALFVVVFVKKMTR